MVGLTTLETRRLRTDMIEVYNVLRVSKEQMMKYKFQRRLGSTRGHSLLEIV